MRLLMWVHRTSLDSLENMHNCLKNNTMYLVECSVQNKLEQAFLAVYVFMLE